MATTLYSQKNWRELRERLHADAECALAHLVGGCQGSLQLHHIKPVSEGGPEIPTEDGVAWLCTRHHRFIHGLLNRQRRWKTCPHHHTSREAREQCEQRLNAA